MPRANIYRATGHLTGLVIVGVVVAVLTIAAWRAGSSLGQSSFNAALVLALPCWLAYSFLFLVAYRISVADGVVRWTAPLAHGERDVHDLADVRARWPGFVRFRFRDGRTVLVQWSVGFGAFAQQLTKDYPEIRIDRGAILRA